MTAMRTYKPTHEEPTERRIQETQLLERLQAQKAGKRTMTPTQILAAKIVIRKSLPPSQRGQTQKTEGQ